ncbi:MAG: Tryptophan--tRNA ligase [Candidatus Omnitrophica bacterium ADurb.Bin314]|nr:MAG: Tryptophan--tRNA ligase [Candidatus Omnitrophica bacterium ADurb.Bin314]
MSRILSGTRPTGKLHLGHLLGTLENYRKMQGHDSFFMIADLHALTTEYEHKTTIAEKTTEVMVDYLASGLDPEKCTIFIQSEVQEHAMLGLLFSMITPLGWLERNPTYKDQIRELKGKDLHTHGFLGYPVLQAADIAIYKADKVPVGEDQLPHIELTREIIRRFHHLYEKEVFPEPDGVLTQAPRVPGLDGRKMSKSYGNCIYLSDTREEVTKKVLTQMVTDPARKRREDKGDPEKCPVFFYHKLFNPDNTDAVACACRNATRGCVDCKKEMCEKLNQYLDPIREKRALWLKKTKEIREILDKGAVRARSVASQTLKEASRAMGLLP